MLIILEQLNDVFKNSKIIQEDNLLITTIKIDNKKLELLRILDSKYIIEEYSRNGSTLYDINDIELKDSIKITFNKSELSINFDYDYFNTFNDFLEKNRTRLLSKYFFIADKNYSSISSSEKIIELINYENMLILSEVISKIAVNNEKEANSDYKYIIFDKRRIIINSVYEEKDLTKLFKNEKIELYIKELYQEIISDFDRRINGIFFINAIEDIYQKKQDINFKDLMEDFLEIYYEYQVHHRAYVNTLDLGKMKSEAEKSLKEEFSKVNSLISDINSKIIFLPIAFIGILTQLDSKNPFSKNIFILIFMFVFMIIVQKFTNIQQEMLKIIEEETLENEEDYKKTKKLYESLTLKIERIKKLIKVLKDRLDWTIHLNMMLFLVVIVLGPFKILCQTGKIKNTKGHRDEDRNRCRAICS